jgi:hypothetical protein
LKGGKEKRNKTIIVTYTTIIEFIYTISKYNAHIFIVIGIMPILYNNVIVFAFHLRLTLNSFFTSSKYNLDYIRHVLFM